MGTWSVPSLFLISTRPFRIDYVADCSTTRRSATEKNEMSGDGTAPYMAVGAQSSRTLKFGIVLV